jgi:hypothetical protein
MNADHFSQPPPPICVPILSSPLYLVLSIFIQFIKRPHAWLGCYHGALFIINVASGAGWLSRYTSLRAGSARYNVWPSLGETADSVASCLSPPYTHPSLFAASNLAVSQIRGIAPEKTNTSLGLLH